MTYVLISFTWQSTCHRAVAQTHRLSEYIFHKITQASSHQMLVYDLKFISLFSIFKSLSTQTSVCLTKLKLMQVAIASMNLKSSEGKSSILLVMTVSI